MSLRHRNVRRALVTGFEVELKLMSSIGLLPVVMAYNIGDTSRLRTRGSIRLRSTVPAKTDTHD